MHEAIIKQEAAHLTAEIKRHVRPNSPNRTHCMAQVPLKFLRRASTADMEALLAAIPYKTAYLSTLNFRRDIYVFVDFNEVQENKRARVAVEDGKRENDADSIYSGDKKA